MQLFYHPSLDSTTDLVTFDKGESNHIVKVLRKNTGDHLHITNGKGDLFLAEITNTHPGKCQIKILESHREEPLGYQLNIVVAPTKSNDRMEWFIEKATEIGVTSIIPVICKHSERKKINLSRYQRVAESAMKQSLQTYLPEITEAVPFFAFLSQELEGQKFIAHCEEDDIKYILKKQVKPTAQVTILIGPEGDFSADEIEEAQRRGFLPVSLGKTRLRTETAALAACHTVALINQ